MQYNFTVRKKDKGYQIIVSYKQGLKWRQKSKQGFATQREAKEYGLLIVDKLKKTTALTADSSLKNITLYDFFEIYKRDKQNTLSYNTLSNYTRSIKAYTSLVDKPMTDITYQDLMQSLNAMELSNRSKNLSIIVGKLLFNYAISPYKIIISNPFADIKLLKIGTNARINVFTQDELDTLFKGLNTKPYYQFYLACSIARYTGLRYGEIMALNWSDIANNQISVTKQFTMIGYKQHGLKPTKTTNSMRKVPIPPVLLEILTEYKKASNTEQLFVSNSSKTSRINFVIQKFVPGKTFHDFRHTYATTLLANKVDIKTVASLLGDTVNTVINVYVHYTEEMEQKAANDVAKIFG